MRMRDFFFASPAPEKPPLYERLSAFFLGGVYPAAVTLAVLLGHVLAAETVAMSAILLSAALAVFVTDSALPLIAPLVTVFFTLSRTHSPGVPAFSGYLSSGARPYILAISALLLALSLARLSYRALRRGVRPERQYLLPVALLALAFLLNGALSADWSARSLAFGLAEAAVYLIPHIILALGLSGRSLLPSARYLAYVSALSVLLLSAELAWLYTGPDAPFAGGELIKSEIVFGWGIWTSMGAALAVLIPACFVGVISSHSPHLYLGAATLAVAAIFATASRGAILVGCAVYLLCLVLTARLSLARRTSLALIAVSVGLLVGALIASAGNIGELLSRLFDDNGRFRLWRIGISELLSAPIFGTGFFGFAYPEGEGYFTGADFLPPMLHSTPLELLSATGLFGTACYAVYRISSIRPALRDPHPVRLLLLFSGGVMLLLGLIENYPFQFWPVLHYSVALAMTRLPRDPKPQKNNLSYKEKTNVRADDTNSKEANLRHHLPPRRG